MLVQFLSFVATVLGTARYKAIFLSCLALVFALTGITATALLNGTLAPDASSAVEQKDGDEEKQGFAPQLGGIRNQTTKEHQAQQPTNTQAPANEPQNTANGPSEANPKPAASSFDITLNTATSLVLAPDSSTIIAATVGDGNDVAWSVSPAEGCNNSVHVVGQDSSPSFGFQIKVDKLAESGSSCQFVVTAKDATHNITASKTIIVTIQ